MTTVMPPCSVAPRTPRELSAISGQVGRGVDTRFLRILAVATTLRVYPPLCTLIRLIWGQFSNKCRKNAEISQPGEMPVKRIVPGGTRSSRDPGPPAVGGVLTDPGVALLGDVAWGRSRVLLGWRRRLAVGGSRSSRRGSGRLNRSASPTKNATPSASPSDIAFPIPCPTINSRRMTRRRTTRPCQGVR